MREIFLSYRYDEPNIALARLVEQLVESHSLRAVTGDVLGGDTPTRALPEQVGQADALVALLTRREQLAAGGWTTHPFCLDELKDARRLGKPAIAFLEQGVEVGGYHTENEYIPFDATDPLPAFLRLSRTLWRWKRRSGRALKIQLMLQHAVVQQLYANRQQFRWQYRLSTGFSNSDWEPTEPRKEGQGLFVLVHVQDDTTQVEIRIQDAVNAGNERVSGFVPIHIPVTFEG